MAKKNQIDIDVVVDDKGTTKKVGVQAKKAAKGLDAVGNSSRNAQKGIKGVAQTASAGSKNFAGMSRGMQGMVGAYAALAAQMFAISAAFGFFKRAGDLKVLQAGQQAYASATGVAMKTLANDIIAATDAQITFRDASQAAAIGIASGLSTDQLTRLGKAAKDASAILGRDVTDAFNRLVRGVTKAEPELLDELGIILRLETANKKYADSLGIAVTELTQFQKSQAVANEVLSQSETKYSAILAVTGGSAVNQFNKLGKSMDDLVMSIQTGLLPVANAFAKALGEVPLIAGAGFLLLLKGPMQAMGVSMAGLSLAAEEQQAKQAILYDTIANGADKAALSIEKLKKTQNTSSKKIGKMADGKEGSAVSRMAKTGFHTLDKKDQRAIQRSIQNVEKQYKRHEIISRGIFKGIAAGIVLDMQLGFKEVEAAEIALANVDSAVTTKIKTDWASVKVSVTSTAAAIGTAASKLMMWLGWVGIAITVFTTLYNMFKTEIPKTAAEIALERQQERLTALIEEYKLLSVTQKAIFDQTEGKSGAGWVSALGNVLSSTSITDTTAMFDAADRNEKKRSHNRLNEREATYKKDLARQKELKDAGETYEASRMNRSLQNQQKILQATGSKVTGDGVYGWFGGMAMEDRAGDAQLGQDGNGKNIIPKQITDGESNASKFIDQQVDMISKMNDAAGGEGMSKAFTEYANALSLMKKEGLSEDPDERKKQIENLLKLQSGAVEVGHAYANMDKQMAESDRSIRTFFKAFAPLNQAENTMGTISEEIKTLQTVKNDATKSAAAKKNAQDRLAILYTEFELIKELNAADHKRQLTAMDMAETIAETGRNRHKIFKDNALQDVKAQHAQQAVTNAMKEQTDLNAIIAHQTKAKNAGELTYVNAADQTVKLAEVNTVAQEHQLAIIQKKIDSAETLLDWEKELLLFSQDTLKNQLATNAAKMDEKLLGFEKTMMTNENKRLQYAKERLKLIQQEREIALEGTLRAERESNPFAYLSEEKRTAELKYEMAVANRVGEKTLIEQEATMKLAQNDVEYDLLGLKYALLGLEMEKIQAETKATKGDLVGKQTTILLNGDLAEKWDEYNAIGDEIGRLDALNIKLGEYGAKIPGLLAQIEGDTGLRQAGKDAIEGAATGKINKLDAAIEKLLEAKNRLMDINVISDTVAHSFEENMTSAFTSLIQGTASAKEAFSNMAMSILKDISAMIVKMMVFRMLNSLFTTTAPLDIGATDYVSGYDVASIARTGGVFSEGHKVQGYATGGVARGSTSGYPATLHGTEAVVPLPNGRSIPVEMKDSGATNNNIVVNITSDGQSSTQGSTGPDMDKMGGAIARAVQEELQNQKRSGGILNPYGVA